MELANLRELSNAKVMRIIFFIVNALLAILQLFTAFSLWGMVRLIVALALVAVVMFRNMDETVPAVSYLCWLFALQCFAYVSTHFDAIAAQYVPERFESYVRLMSEHPRPDITLMLWTGIILPCIGISRKGQFWLTGVGGGLAGLSIVLTLWTTGELTNLAFRNCGRAVVATTLFLFVYWTVIVYVVCKTQENKQNECLAIGSILFVVFVAINVCGLEYVTSIARGLERTLLTLPDEWFSWWRVTIACALLIGAGFLAHEEVEAAGNGWADEKLLYVSAVLVFALRILMSNYYVYSWLFYLVLVAITLHAFSNALDFKPTFGLQADSFFVADAVAFTFFSLLLCWGLRANVLLTVGFLLIFYYQKPKTDEKAKRKWLLIVTLIVGEAFARMASWRLSIDGCVVLGMVYVMAVVTITILGMKHPAGKLVYSGCYALIAICVAVLCLASLRSPIHVDAITQGASVTVITESDSEANRLQNSYVWKDAHGQAVTEDGSLKQGEQTIPIQGEILTVTTTDSRGVTCMRDFYYAPWVTEYEQKLSKAQ